MLFFSRAVLAFVMGVSTRCVQKKKKKESCLVFSVLLVSPFSCVCVQARRPSLNRQQVRTFSHNSYKRDTFSFVFFSAFPLSLWGGVRKNVWQSKKTKEEKEGEVVRHREFCSALIGMKRSFSALFFFFPPFDVLCMSRGNRQRGTLAKKKKKSSIAFGSLHLQ